MVDARVLFFIFPRPPGSPLFPYTTLFRSRSPHARAKAKSVIHLFMNGGPSQMELFDPKRSEEHTSELQSHVNLVCRLLLEKKNARATILAGAEAACVSQYVTACSPTAAWS